MLFSSPKWGFLTILVLAISCNIPKEEEVSKIVEVYKTYPLPEDCTFSFDYCDTCFLLEDVIQWEESRGAKPVVFDKNSFDISMNLQYGDANYRGLNAFMYNYEGYVAFFYQDTSSFIKEITIYDIGEYKNESSGKKVKYVWYFRKKYFFRSLYLEQHLYSNAFVLEGRKSVRQIDTFPIINNIKVKDFKPFNFQELKTNYFCLMANFEKKYNMELQILSSSSKGDALARGMKINFVVPGTTPVGEVDIYSPWNNKYLGASNLSIDDSLKVFANIFASFNLSEKNRFTKNAGITWSNENFSIGLSLTINQNDGSPLKKKLEKATR